MYQPNTNNLANKTKRRITCLWGLRSPITQPTVCNNRETNQTTTEQVTTNLLPTNQPLNKIRQNNSAPAATKLPESLSTQSRCQSTKQLDHSYLRNWQSILSYFEKEHILLMQQRQENIYEF